MVVEMRKRRSVVPEKVLEVFGDGSRYWGRCRVLYKPNLTLTWADAQLDIRLDSTSARALKVSPDISVLVLTAKKFITTNFAILYTLR
jgi:hypothetical protein